MTDIRLAIIIMTLLSGLFFWASGFCFSKLNHLTKRIIAVLIILLIIFHLWILANSIYIVKLLPFKGSVVYGNLLMPLCAILAGLIWVNRKMPQWRRVLIILVLAVVAYLPIVKILYRPTQSFHDTWNGNVCIQTDQTSCVPAAAATLLGHFNISTTETEMADLCLTNPSGTSFCGLYRGLRIQAGRHNRNVIVRKTNLEELNTARLPAILIVRLTEEVNRRQPLYSQRWGWQVNVSHAVVLYDILDSGKISIGDPSIGKETWDQQALMDLWHGEYITIE